MEVLQQVLRYTTQHTAGEVDTKTSYSCSKDDLAWLGAALEAVGKEESQRLAVHQQCLIDHLSKDTTEILQALEYMEDFVETYDSALGWIQAGGGDLVLELLSSKEPQIFRKVCTFLSTLLQNHIPVQKALFGSPVGSALLGCFGGLQDASGALLNPAFQQPTSSFLSTGIHVVPAVELSPCAAGSGGDSGLPAPVTEHAAWSEQNTAARTSTGHSPEEAAEAVAKTTAQWGHLRVSSMPEVSSLLSAVSCLTRAADSIEEAFVQAEGVRTLAALWCHTGLRADPAVPKLRRKLAVFTKALLMRALLRPRVAHALLAQEGFLHATASVLNSCVQDGELHEVDLLENTLYILQHLAVHAAVQPKGSVAPAGQGLGELQEALGAVQAGLPADSQSNKQIGAIEKALLSAFPE